VIGAFLDEALEHYSGVHRAADRISGEGEEVVIVRLFTDRRDHEEFIFHDELLEFVEHGNGPLQLWATFDFERFACFEWFHVGSFGFIQKRPVRALLDQRPESGIHPGQPGTGERPFGVWGWLQCPALRVMRAVRSFGVFLF